MAELFNDIEEVGPFVEELKALKANGGLKELSSAEIEEKLNEADSINQTIDRDLKEVDEVHCTLANRRVKLQDAETPVTADSKGTRLKKIEEKLVKVDSSIKNLETQVAESDSDAMKEISPEVEELRARWIEADQKTEALNSLYKQILETIEGNNLLESDVAVLTDLIIRIRALGDELTNLVKEILSLDKDTKELGNKANGLDSAAAINAAEERLNEFDEKVESMQQDLTKLIKITKKIDPECTDEEEDFIETMGKDLVGLKRKHKTVAESVRKARTLFDQVKKSIEKKTVKGNLTAADIHSITNESNKIESRITSVGTEVNELSDCIERKKDLYNKVDLEAKLNRRNKQINDVSEYIDEVDRSCGELRTSFEEDKEKASQEGADKKMIEKCDKYMGECDKTTDMILKLREFHEEIQLEIN